MKTMFLTKIKIATVALVVGMMALGGGMLTYRTLAAEGVSPIPVEQKEMQKQVGIVAIAEIQDPLAKNGKPGTPNKVPAPASRKVPKSGTYIIEAPDILRIVADVLSARTELIDGDHLVRPDGTVSLGAYGNAAVAGLTLDQAKTEITKQLASQARHEGLRLRVEVVAANSKVCYLIVPKTDGNQVYRFPTDGRATVTSAVLEFEGLAAVATKGVWIARPAGKMPKVLEVDWQAITGAGRLASNHRLEPGDRVYIGSPPSK